MSISYLESGCMCVLTGKIPKYQGVDSVGVVKDFEWEYYLDNCTCTRHPTRPREECWDKDISIDEKLFMIKKYEGSLC